LLKNKLIKYEIFSTIFITILGVILHFTYEWSNKNLVVGLFSAINESTWEHLKLIYFPILITIIIGNIIFKKDIPNYLSIKTKSLIISLLFIIIFFYSYTGILGYNIAFLNIGSFFISILISEYYFFKNISSIITNKNIYPVILVLLFICFITFTINPIHINLFKDPLTNTYGIYLNK